jgi:hypothetical protein
MIRFLKSFGTVISGNKPKILPLGQLISKIRKGYSDNENWLCLSTGKEELSLSTEVGFGQIDINEDCEDNVYEVYPPIFIQNGLQSSIDEVTLHSCIHWADNLSGCADNQAALKVLQYYLKFDAFPETLDGPETNIIDAIKL